MKILDSIIRWFLPTPVVSGQSALVDNRKEANQLSCYCCRRVPVHAARIGDKAICWQCSHIAFNMLEDVRVPGRMYMSENSQ